MKVMAILFIFYWPAIPAMILRIGTVPAKCKSESGLSLLRIWLFIAVAAGPSFPYIGHAFRKRNEEQRIAREK